MKTPMRTRIFRCLAVVGLLAITLWTQAGTVYTPASVPDPKVNGQNCYVSNPDALLADSDVVWLNNCAYQLDQQTHVELCVAALWSIGDMDAFEFAYELFQRWGIGRVNQNTGVLILFVYESHDIRIMTGTGIEGVLTDGRCSDIIHDDMIPAFRAGDYGGGLCLGALRIYDICSKGETPEELLAMRSTTYRGKYAEASSSNDNDENDDWPILIWIAVIVAAIIGWVKSILWLDEHPKCPICKKRKNSKVLKKVTLVNANYDHGGNGYNECFCATCNHNWTAKWETAKLTRSSSSSSSSSSRSYRSSSSSRGSWGGGSTSGGGAGGKW